jgi:hypothetical protein
MSREIVLESPVLTKELLETALKSSKNVYIVLDGLDECDAHEKRAIISWFQLIAALLLDTELDSIRCLFISQDDREIKRLLSKIPAICIKPEDVRLNIQTYAAFWSSKIQKKFDLTNNKQEAILWTVTKRANSKGTIIC